MFLFPLLLLWITTSRNLAQLVVEHDPQTVGLGISLVSVYWGITALVLGANSVDTQGGTTSSAPRANYCSSVVCFSSDLLSGYLAHPETSFPYIFHAERPDAEIFQRSAIYGVCPSRPNIYPYWYVVYTFFVRIVFSPHSKVVTASSTVNDIMRVLVQHQIIPANYGGIYTLSYARVGSLRELSTMASLRAGSLSHFHLRACVRGGACKWFIDF